MVSYCLSLELVTGVCQLPSGDLRTQSVKGRKENEGMTAEGYGIRRKSLEQCLTESAYRVRAGGCYFITTAVGVVLH